MITTYQKSFERGGDYSSPAQINRFISLGRVQFRFPRAGIIRKILWDVHQIDNDSYDVLPITYRMFTLFAQKAGLSLPQGATGDISNNDLIIVSSDPLGLVDLNIPIGQTQYDIVAEIKFAFGQYNPSDVGIGDTSIFHGFFLIEFDDLLDKPAFKPIQWKGRGYE